MSANHRISQANRRRDEADAEREARCAERSAKNAAWAAGKFNEQARTNADFERRISGLEAESAARRDVEADTW